MAEKITENTIEYIASLAKLELTGGERRQAGEDMEKMLGYISLLEELDTGDAQPAFHISPLENVFREDVVTNGDGSRGTLQNAPDAENGMFVVPRTVD